VTAAQFEYQQMGGEVRQTLHFTVWRPFVSTNHQYTIVTYRKNGKSIHRLANTKEADAFKKAVRDHALAARMRSKWPLPDAVKHVAVKIVVFNTGHDCAAADKLVCDGMEGVLYARDKVAHPRLSDIASDAGKPRVEVTVELLRSV
jgi:hypothetical protein